MSDNKVMQKMLIIIGIVIILIIFAGVGLKMLKDNNKNNTNTPQTTENGIDINSIEESEILNLSVDPNDKANGLAFWKYRANISSIDITVTDTLPEIEQDVSSDFEWDLSKNQDKSIIGYIGHIYDTTYDLHIVSKGKILMPENSSGFFRGFSKIKTFSGLEYLDISKVTNMSGFFQNFGYYNMGSLSLGDDFDTSNVTNMNSMFEGCGYKNMTNLYLGTKFNTVNVIQMNSMFYNCGHDNMESLNLGDNFDTLKTTSMVEMFKYCGEKSMTSLELGSAFTLTGKNKDNVKDMFLNCGIENGCTIERNGDIIKSATTTENQ